MGKSNVLSVIAIMSIFFVLMGIGIITPAIQNIVEAFPDIPFTTVLFISTLPSLFIVPSSIISGVLAGSKVKFRTLLIIGLTLYVIGGSLPYFQNNFTMILISRSIFGIGAGIIFPLGSALILKLFEGQQRANMLGASNMVMNIGGIALQMGGALLCAVSWRHTFLAHLTGLLALVLLVFFLPEPEQDAPKTNSSKVKMSLGVYIIALLTVVNVILRFPMLLNMSTMIINDNLGNAASAGVVLSTFTVGGMIGGAIFGKLNQIVGRFALGIGCAVGGISLLVGFSAHSIVMLMVATFFAGMSGSHILLSSMMILGKIVPPAGFGTASGILMAMMSLGGFISPFYIRLLNYIFGNTDVRFPLLIGCIACILIGITVLLVFTKINPEKTSPET